MEHNGEQLKQAMTDKGVSCDYLAKKINKTTATIINYRGKDFIKPQTKEEIAKGLGMEVTQIFKI